MPETVALDSGDRLVQLVTGAAFDKIGKSDSGRSGSLATQGWAWTIAPDGHQRHPNCRKVKRFLQRCGTLRTNSARCDKTRQNAVDTTGADNPSTAALRPMKCSG
ncbi:hypothetical protein C7S18_10805 [Ahniella affigens]|uniref:Uncharacterized protein n=1 Tax=Ahniella affigens TaxID=2021234 RepID=A0A2P1PS43_9GAMM|nr:hypothetical protein C7S18_10805 [Ahniella affigens]